MLSRIHLERFKKFQNITVELRPFTVLMGENSSGKTTVIQAINLALNTLAAHDFISADNGNVKIRKRGVGLTTLPGMSLADYRELYYAKIHRGGSTKGAEGASIELVDDKNNIYRLRITSLFGSYNIKCLSAPKDLKTSPNLHNTPPLFISGFVGLSLSEERAFPRILQDRLRSGHVSTIIRNLVLDAKQKSADSFKKLQQRLAKDFDFYLDEDINFDTEHDLFVKAHFRDIVGKNSISLDFNSSGSGFMQVLQILAPIYLFCPKDAKIVLLDEPDAHLHPNLQSALARALREIQKELGIQVIISTHSTSIIRAADPSEVVPISSLLDVNKPLSSAYDVEQQISSRIDTYELGKSVISGKILFVEDGNTAVLDAFDRVSGTKCFSGANTIPVLSGKGKDDKSPYQIYDVLRTFIKSDIEIHAIRDGDGLNPVWRTKLEKYAQEHNVILHILNRHEIENYLLEPSLILKALSKNNKARKLPKVDDIKEKILHLSEETIKLAKFSYDDNLEDSIWKTAILVGDQEFRNPVACKSEAKKIRESYEAKTDFEDLVIVGMGKETLNGVLRWINEDLKLKLSRTDILDSLDAKHIPEEFLQILQNLRSKEAKPIPVEMPVVPDEIEEDYSDESLMRQLELL
jgi:AAA15 family ATPase/GTPase